MKNSLTIVFICIVYFLIAVATTWPEKDVFESDYSKCLYKLRDSLTSPTMGNTYFSGQYAADTLIYRISDTSKISKVSNLICSQLKDTCKLTNKTILYYDTTFKVIDTIRNIRGRLILTKTCN